ncbi:CYTH-like domain-containing protein [Halteromyces radiatus]|uniref:CYTH-like domain-containing protein n=1 Tax=Halteromyces radiatus TaxID=101107 RepID=UPI00221FA278|nr:CYTH-like domain-containing protein [Halteromyces radiatus]KAI8099206.1 CYTH-like domain-containing protein [Halteromyces radiatus]
MAIYKEPSIFNFRPMDDITKVIHDFITKYCGQQYVEIEAKLGVFIDKHTNERLFLDCETETVIPQHMSRQIRFESNMPLQQHKYYNNMFNDLVNKSQAKDYKGERIKYRHTRETDRFHDMGGRKKCRVTIDQQTGKIVPDGIIEKVRLEDLNIHSPTQPLDYRISINLEIPQSMPESPYIFERNKDRLSYQHGGLNFDLTQVKGGQTNDMEVRHELELEFMDAELLQIEKLKLDRKEPSSFTLSIERFVNNIRILSKHAKMM